MVGGSYNSVKTLSSKNLFRNFLKKNNYNTPWFFYDKTISGLIKKYPGGKSVLKPIDSSGSKGVFVVDSKKDIEKNFKKSKSISKKGEVILEEYIEKKGPQIHGEGFVKNGKIIFLELGDQFFSSVNNMVPYSTIFPSYFHKDIIKDVYKIVKRFVKDVKFDCGGINIEVIRGFDNKIYILEIGPRNGGNFMPQLAQYATGFDLVEANINVLFNKEIVIKNNKNNGYFAQVILHSKKDGILKGINIPNEFKDCVVDKFLYFKKGDNIKKYRDSRDVIGVVIIHIDNDSKLFKFNNNLYKYNWVELK